MENINAKEYQLKKIFNSDFEFYIPLYQRPYSWTEEETNILFDDLYSSYLENKENEDIDYFLGSIVLIKKEDSSYSDVIDGQQRLTTLTILLSTLASKFKDTDNEKFKMCMEFIIARGNEFTNVDSKPRLTIGKNDNGFFHKYVQNVKFEDLKDLDNAKIPTDAQRNIKNNSLLLLNKIDETFEDLKEIELFLKFLLNSCYIVVVSTPNKNSAVRIFSVMNNRGMSLLPIDLIKADIIDPIETKTEKEKYTDKWEEIEIELTRDGFNDLFGHIRTIKSKTKARKSLYEEFRHYVLSKITNDISINFIDNILVPYANAYSQLKNCNYISDSYSSEINNLLIWLNKIDNSDWIPPAILFCTKNLNDPEKILIFLKKLEKLAAFMRINSSNINDRISRYSEIIEEIDKNNNDIPKSINLTNHETKTFLELLKSDIYDMVPAKRNYIILRLDSFISDNAAKYDYKILTIEHVLPQTVDEGSEWAKKWPNEKIREKWLHKIGNLVPLSKRKNSEARNYNFKDKKEIYFKSKRTGVSSYSLTTDVLTYKDWTPDIVEERQNKLIEIFKDKWELELTKRVKRKK